MVGQVRTPPGGGGGARGPNLDQVGGSWKTRRGPREPTLLSSANTNNPLGVPVPTRTRRSPPSFQSDESFSPRQGRAALHFTCIVLAGA